MKQFVILIMSWLSFQSVEAQAPPKQSLVFGVGYSKHGTGDMKGVNFDGEYTRSFGKRTEWCVNALSTIHGDAFTVIINQPDGATKDVSYRYSNAGMQIGPKVGFRILQSTHHQLKIQAGAFARYQNSTFPNEYGTTIDPFGETVKFDFEHEEKQNTFSGGYSVDLCYNIITSRKLILGIKAGFQNDTNADAILHITLFAGRCFSKLL